MTKDDLKGTSWAFPWLIEDEMMSPGMSLRDWFAGQALTCILANESLNKCCDDMARSAYILADAMLAARNNTSNTNSK